MLSCVSSYMNSTHNRSLQFSSSVSFNSVLKHSYLSSMVYVYSILSLLNCSSSISVKDVSLILNIPLSTTYYYVNKLISKGLVVKSGCLLYLTVDGVSTLLFLKSICKLCEECSALGFKSLEGLGFESLESSTKGATSSSTKSFKSTRYTTMSRAFKTQGCGFCSGFSVGGFSSSGSYCWSFSPVLFFVDGFVFVVFDVGGFSGFVSWFYGSSSGFCLSSFRSLFLDVFRVVSRFVSDSDVVKRIAFSVCSLIVSRFIGCSCCFSSSVSYPFSSVSNIIRGFLCVERSSEFWCEASLVLDWSVIRSVFRFLGFYFGSRRSFLSVYAKCVSGLGDVLKVEKCLHSDLVDLVYDLGLDLFTKDAILMVFMASLIFKYLRSPKSLLYNIVDLAYCFNLDLSIQTNL